MIKDDCFCSAKALKESILWAMHLSVDKILFECGLKNGGTRFALKMAKSIDYALVNAKYFYGEIWVRVPFSSAINNINNFKSNKFFKMLTRMGIKKIF